MDEGEDGLPEAGLSLWLTDWNVRTGWRVGTESAWTGRRLLALVGGAVAGHLDFRVHPDGQALTVWWLNIEPDFQGRGLAGLLMDALYAAHPDAWINHGTRGKDGTWWWNSYRDPDPGRNIHNRPPVKWASYFDAVQVAADMAENAHRTDRYGLHAHRDAVHRYGERLEEEADRYQSAFRQASATNIDPAAQPLHGAAQLFLPTDLHSYVHDRDQDPAGRAEALLEHLGHGNLPNDTNWHTTRRAGFDDAYHDQLLQGPEAITRPATHVVFTLDPLPATGLPPYTARSSFLDFAGSADVAVELTGLSWRLPEQPWPTHVALFTPSVAAAIAPPRGQEATAVYRSRYDAAGFRLPPARSPSTASSPYAHRAAQIRALADQLLHDVAARAAGPPPTATPAPAHPSQPPVPRQQQPRPRR